MRPARSRAPPLRLPSAGAANLCRCGCGCLLSFECSALDCSHPVGAAESDACVGGRAPPRRAAAALLGQVCRGRQASNSGIPIRLILRWLTASSEAAAHPCSLRGRRHRRARRESRQLRRRDGPHVPGVVAAAVADLSAARATAS